MICSGLFFVAEGCRYYRCSQDWRVIEEPPFAFGEKALCPNCQWPISHATEAVYPAEIRNVRQYRLDGVSSGWREFEAETRPAHKGVIMNVDLDTQTATDQLRALLSVIEAHDCISLSCDRDGQEYCECLQEAAQKARQYLDSTEARPAATKE